MFDEAKKHYNKIIALSPGNQRASARLAEIAREENELKEFAKLTDAVEELEGYLPPVAAKGVLAASPSDDEAVRSLMQEIQQLKEQPASPAPSAIEKEIVAPTLQIAADAVSKPLEPAKKAEEEDFFDLGAELQREAAAEGDVSATEGREGVEVGDDHQVEKRHDVRSEPHDPDHHADRPQHPRHPQLGARQIFRKLRMTTFWEWNTNCRSYRLSMIMAGSPMKLTCRI